MPVVLCQLKSINRMPNPRERTFAIEEEFEGDAPFVREVVGQIATRFRDCSGCRILSIKLTNGTLPKQRYAICITFFICIS